jgi:hypothetical protein
VSCSDSWSGDQSSSDQGVLLRLFLFGALGVLWLRDLVAVEGPHCPMSGAILLALERVALTLGETSDKARRFLFPCSWLLGSGSGGGGDGDGDGVGVGNGQRDRIERVLAMAKLGLNAVLDMADRNGGIALKQRIDSSTPVRRKEALRIPVDDGRPETLMDSRVATLAGCLVSCTDRLADCLT